MRTNIRLIPEGEEFAGWWTYDRTCYKCGCELNSIISSHKPDKDEPDYCMKCFNVDDIAAYYEAKKKRENSP